MKSVKIGFAPTRRSIFSAPDAVKYANLTRERLKELGVEFVDITDINEEGLFYDEADREKIQEKFRRENVKGIFFPHGNFGTEYVCARLAKEMGLPVLLWGPRDERPDENGVRLRDSQCGLFATGKVLRRFGVPFTPESFRSDRVRSTSGPRCATRASCWKNSIFSFPRFRFRS